MSKLFEFNVVYKPFGYPRAVELTVESERMHWIEEEIDLSDDVSDWKMGKMNEAEKNFITQILRMFTQSDIAVGTFYLDQLIPVFKNNEVRNMLSSFCTREGVHQRAYALLNDTLGLPEKEYSAFFQYQEMAEKNEFMFEADNSSIEGIARCLAKGVCNEGVTLFASFAMLLNFQRRGLMKGMGKVVEWSQKDEETHVTGVTWLFRTLCKEHPEIVTDELKKSIYEMVKRCVELEDAFIDLAFGLGGIGGISPQEVKDYVRFIADRRLVQMGLKENWGIEKNPLPWIDILMNAPDHTNFFENKVTEYEAASLVGEWTYSTAIYRVYGRDDCPYCEQAKELLGNGKFGYEYVDLSDVMERQAFYDDRGFVDDDRRVPKVYRIAGDDELYIGGFSDLKKYLTTYND